jgi:hypothetical protein
MRQFIAESHGYGSISLSPRSAWSRRWRQHEKRLQNVKNGFHSPLVVESRTRSRHGGYSQLRIVECGVSDCRMRDERRLVEDPGEVWRGRSSPSGNGQNPEER